MTYISLSFLLRPTASGPLNPPMEEVTYRVRRRNNLDGLRVSVGDYEVALAVEYHILRVVQLPLRVKRRRLTIGGRQTTNVLNEASVIPVAVNENVAFGIHGQTERTDAGIARRLRSMAVRENSMTLPVLLP